jgi:hypothetical protein
VRRPQIVVFALPVVETAPGHGFEEGADAVGRYTDQPGLEDGDQVGGLLRGESSVGDRLLVREDVGDSVYGGVEL